MTAFVTRHPVRFAHCDPAGIAYYPRLLEICDGAIEDWTAEVMGVPRRILHLELELALPTVDLRASFVRPVRLGETLTIATIVGAVGRSSVELTTAAKFAITVGAPPESEPNNNCGLRSAESVSSR